MSNKTTLYGTWSSRVNVYATGPDADVDGYVGTGDEEWRDRVQESGVLGRMKQEYRAAIEAVLPPDVSLCGEEFIGPAHPDEGEFDGYPKDRCGSLDFKAMVKGVDFDAIMERNDPDNEEN